MKCPACGEYNASHIQRCHCGYDLIPQTLQQHPIDEGATKQSVSSNQVMAWGLRRCAKCGSLMYMYLCEEMYINGAIPSGKRLHFRCVRCRKEIKIRSPWRRCLLVFGTLLFA